ncbi:MAG: hypothetical protein HQ546_08900 [Planctomycetes bacterium]|nr:hypothetical protein [Planctomycetota bacterium]
MNRLRRNAFTLVEVVLAVGLALGLMGAALGLYNHIASLRKNVLAELDRTAMCRSVMDRITDELRCAMIYPFLQAGLEGDAGRVRFISATLPGAAAWAVRSGRDEPVPAEHDVEWIGYRLRIVEDEQGQERIDGLERTCQKLLTAMAAEEGKQIRAELVAPSIRFLRLRFYDGTGWIESWTGGDLPMAVEITLGTGSVPEKMDVEDYLAAYETFRRVVAIPASKVDLATTVTTER